MAARCRDMIIDKRLSVDRVANRIQEEYEDFLNVMFSDENAEQLVLRIRCGRRGVRIRCGHRVVGACGWLGGWVGRRDCGCRIRGSGVLSSCHSGVVGSVVSWVGRQESPGQPRRRCWMRNLQGSACVKRPQGTCVMGFCKVIPSHPVEVGGQVMIIAGQKSPSQALWVPTDWVFTSCALLAAPALGHGSCWQACGRTHERAHACAHTYAHSHISGLSQICSDSSQTHARTQIRT